MTLQQLRYLIAIAEYGSINAAAHNLYASQSNLSTAIKELEGELGITIFTRSNRGVTLTNDGTELLGYARQVVEQADMLEERYAKGDADHTRLAISTQHYAFSVQAFMKTADAFAGSGTISSFANAQRARSSTTFERFEAKRGSSSPMISTDASSPRPSKTRTSPSTPSSTRAFTCSSAKTIPLRASPW